MGEVGTVELHRPLNHNSCRFLKSQDAMRKKAMDPRTLFPTVEDIDRYEKYARNRPFLMKTPTYEAEVAYKAKVKEARKQYDESMKELEKVKGIEKSRYSKTGRKPNAESIYLSTEVSRMTLSFLLTYFHPFLLKTWKPCTNRNSVSSVPKRMRI